MILFILEYMHMILFILEYMHMILFILEYMHMILFILEYMHMILFILEYMHMILFFVRYAFLPSLVPKSRPCRERRGWDLMTSDGKTHTARKTISCAFSCTLR